MNIIAVASAKGGVGKSTFCCSVGKILALHGQRVLLVDVDIGVRSLDILLGVAEKTVYNWGDVIKGNCEYRKAVTEISNGLYLMAAPIDFCDEYTIESFKAMIYSLEKDFDYILLDAPAGLDMIDWKSVMDLLYTKNYDGMLSIEPHSHYWKGKKGQWGIDYTINYFRPMIMPEDYEYEDNPYMP